MAPPPHPWCRTPQGAPSSSKNEDGAKDGDEDADEDGSELTVILFNLAR